MLTALAIVGGLAALAFIYWLGSPLSSPTSSRAAELAADRVVVALRAEASAAATRRPPMPLATVFRAYLRAGVEVVPSAELVRALRAEDPRLSVTEAFDLLEELEEADALQLVGCPAHAVRAGDLALSPRGPHGDVLAGARTLIPLSRLRSELAPPGSLSPIMERAS